MTSQGATPFIMISWAKLNLPFSQNLPKVSSILFSISNAHLCYSSSSEDASIDTSSSSSSMGASSSSLSSSLLRLTPWILSPSDVALLVVASRGLGGRRLELAVPVVLLVVEDGGALNIDCCNSVAVTVAATVGGL